MSTHLSDIKLEDWISQAEAARLRGVSRQAIAKLIRKERVRTLEIGGNTFVNKNDIEAYQPLPAGRPKKDE